MKSTMTNVLLAGILIALATIAVQLGAVPSAFAQSPYLYGCYQPSTMASNCQSWEPIRVDKEGRLIVAK